MADATTNRRRGRVAAVITVIVAILVMAFCFVPAVSGASTGSSSSSSSASKTTKPTAAQIESTQAALKVTKVTPSQLESLTTSKYSKISQVLLESSLSSNDKKRTESNGFSDALTYGFEASDDASRFAELEEEVMRNPVYGVTVARAFMDKKIGDKTIAELNPWMSEMVALNDQNGVAYWCEYRESDQNTLYVTDEYRQYAASLCTFLERLVPQGVHAWETVENWPLNGAAKNNDRRGVKADYQYTKDAFILSYVSKAQDGSVAGEGLFVVGFNVHDKRPEFYGGTPEEPTPSYPPSVTPPSVTPPDNPDNPDNPPDNPKYDKDPSKAPQKNTESNDDPGPGESTNNGKGATESTKDQSTNSNHMTYEEYQKEVNGLAETNKSQKTGSDSNTPSTPKPSTDTKVDNNGDKGTSTSAPINAPTPTAPPATDASTGESIDSTPGEAWGGPSD